MHSGAQQAELQLAAAWQVGFLCCPLPLMIKLCMIHIPVGSPTLLTICSKVGSTGCPTAAGTLYFSRMPSNSYSPLCLETILPPATAVSALMCLVVHFVRTFIVCISLPVGTKAVVLQLESGLESV